MEKIDPIEEIRVEKQQVEQKKIEKSLEHILEEPVDKNEKPIILNTEKPIENKQKPIEVKPLDENPEKPIYEIKVKFHTNEESPEYLNVIKAKNKLIIPKNSPRKL